jgi:hypothetical protein
MLVTGEGQTVKYSPFTRTRNIIFIPILSQAISTKYPMKDVILKLSVLEI